MCRYQFRQAGIALSINGEPPQYPQRVKAPIHMRGDDAIEAMNAIVARAGSESSRAIISPGLVKQSANRCLAPVLDHPADDANPDAEQDIPDQDVDDNDALTDRIGGLIIDQTQRRSDIHGIVKS